MFDVDDRVSAAWHKHIQTIINDETADQRHLDSGGTGG
jgi:hypothetical protein